MEERKKMKMKKSRKRIEKMLEKVLLCYHVRGMTLDKLEELIIKNLKKEEGYKFATYYDKQGIERFFFFCNECFNKKEVQLDDGEILKFEDISIH